MNYKSKIKSYKTEVDENAWQSMESLLDAQSQVNEANNTTEGYLRRFKKWLFLGGCCIVLLTGIYLINVKYFQSDRFSVNIENTENQHSMTFGIADEKPSQSINQKSEVSNKSLKGDIENVDNSIQQKPVLGEVENEDKNRSNLSFSNQNQNQVPIDQRGSLAGFGNGEREGNNRIKSSELKTSNSVTQTKNSTEALEVEDGKLGDGVLDDGETDLKNQEKLEANYYEGAKIDGGITDFSNADEQKGVTLDEEDSENKKQSTTEVLDLDDLPTLGLNLLESPKMVLPVTPTFIEPNSIPKRFAIGLEIGPSKYLHIINGVGISIYGLYEVYPWLRTGLRFNKTNLAEGTQYLLSPEIIEKRSETGLDLYTQIVPLRFWIINIGADFGYGITHVSENNRVSGNPEPNKIEITESSRSYNSKWFYLGAHVTFNITQSVTIGATVGTNTGTETSHLSGRIVYKL